MERDAIYHIIEIARKCFGATILVSQLQSCDDMM